MNLVGSYGNSTSSILNRVSYTSFNMIDDPLYCCGTHTPVENGVVGGHPTAATVHRGAKTFYENLCKHDPSRCPFVIGFLNMVTFIFTCSVPGCTEMGAA
jgi:hypothetical protein